MKKCATHWFHTAPPGAPESVGGREHRTPCGQPQLPRRGHMRARGTPLFWSIANAAAKSRANRAPSAAYTSTHLHASLYICCDLIARAHPIPCARARTRALGARALPPPPHTHTHTSTRVRTSGIRRHVGAPCQQAASSASQRVRCTALGRPRCASSTASREASCKMRC